MCPEYMLSRFNEIYFFCYLPILFSFGLFFSLSFLICKKSSHEKNHSYRDNEKKDILYFDSWTKIRTTYEMLRINFIEVHYGFNILYRGCSCFSTIEKKEIRKMRSKNIVWLYFIYDKYRANVNLQ